MSSNEKIKPLIKIALKNAWEAWRIIKMLWLSDRVLCWLASLLTDDG